MIRQQRAFNTATHEAIPTPFETVHAAGDVFTILADPVLSFAGFLFVRRRTLFHMMFLSTMQAL